MVERLLNDDGKGYVLKSNVRNPFPTGYKPELDVMEELDQKLASRYMQLADWNITLGRGNWSH